MEGEMYCPVCGETLTAENIVEVKNKTHDGFIFIHKDVPHSEEEIAALEHGVN